MEYKEFKVINLNATGANLRNLMKEKNVKVLDVASILLTSPQSVYSWLNGHSIPSVDNLLNLAGILNVSMEDILICEILK